MPTEIEAYKTFRDYIKHEDQLINYRMTWMLTIHGFLYATFGLTLQKLLEIIEKGASAAAVNVCTPSFGESYAHNVPLSDMTLDVKAFLYCLCIVGELLACRCFIRREPLISPFAQLRKYSRPLRSQRS